MSLQNITIKIGDIEAPVSIHKAFDDKAVELNHLGPDGLPIRRINIDSNGEEIKHEDILVGYKYADGQYIVIDKDELKSLNDDKTTTFDVEYVVELAMIDPAFFDSPYFLGLDSRADETYATHQYGRLFALLDEGNAAIGEIVLRGKNHVVAIYKGHGPYLMMSTLRYLADMREPVFVLDQTPDEDTYHECETILQRKRKNLNLAKYRNHHSDRMKDLITNKVAVLTGTTDGKKVKHGNH